MKHSIIRWALFLTVGLPVQAITYLIYPIVVILFRKKWKNKHGVSFSIPTEGLRSLQEIVDNGSILKMRNEVYADSPDEHTALVHYGTWSYTKPFVAHEGLRRLVRSDGSLERIFPVNPNANPISRDCLVSWLYSYAMFGGPKDELKKIGKHYLKYCFGLTHTNGLVSARNSCSGVNYVFDGHRGINQPLFGPGYYGSAALLALMRKEFGGIWHLIYFLHFIVMGGWLWWVEPIIYNDKFLIYYDHHITALSLATLQHVSPSPLTKQALRRVVVDIAPSNNVNAFYYATAWNAGALTETERAKAVMVLRNIAQFWPQDPALNSHYLNGKGGLENWSMMGYHAKLLMNKPFTKFQGK